MNTRIEELRRLMHQGWTRAETAIAAAEDLGVRRGDARAEAVAMAASLRARQGRRGTRPPMGETSGPPPTRSQST